MTKELTPNCIVKDILEGKTFNSKEIHSLTIPFIDTCIRHLGEELFKLRKAQPQDAVTSPEVIRVIKGLGMFDRVRIKLMEKRR
jgi:hypothetical protein